MSMRPVFATPLDLFRALRSVWSAETASPEGGWSPSLPAKNHCSVTALIVQEVFGGDILRTETAGGMHFYNRIDGHMWDLTVSQFDEPICYQDVKSSRAEALRDCGSGKLEIIRQRLDLV